MTKTAKGAADSDAPDTTDEQPREAAPRQFAKYTAFPGIVSERAFTREDFKALGIEHDTVSFNRQNRYMVDITDLPDEVVQVLKDHSDEFSFSGSEAPPRMVGNSAVAESGNLPGPQAAVGGTVSSTGAAGTTTGGTTGARGSTTTTT